MKNLQINYLAVLVAAIATFMLGAAWYMGFDATWQRYAGVTEETLQSSGGPIPAMLISFITYVLGAYAMAYLFKSMGVSTLKTGAITGAIIGALLIGGNIFTNNAYEMKPIGLSVLNTGFSVLSCAVQGAILGAWKKYST